LRAAYRRELGVELVVADLLRLRIRTGSRTNRQQGRQKGECGPRRKDSSCVHAENLTVQ
jgi:hypothetical protein